MSPFHLVFQSKFRLSDCFEQFSWHFVVWWDHHIVGYALRMCMTDSQLDSLQFRVKQVLLGQKHFSTTRYHPITDVRSTATSQALHSHSTGSGVELRMYAPSPPPTPQASPRF